MGIVEDELSATSVFADRSKLDFNYVPPALPHRDEEMRRLAALFRVVADQRASQSAFITGPVGTGKTVLSKKFCTEFVDAARKNNLRVDAVQVNCRRNASEGLVLAAIIKTLDPHYKEKGFSTSEMMRDLRRQLERRGSHCIVVLDEADALVQKEGSDLVYALTRFDDERPAAQAKSTLSVILISARSELPLMLDEAARSTLRRTNVVVLKKYDADQLLDIVAQRADLAFHKRAVDPDVLELISEIAAEDGDARYAIELLDLSGRLADEEGAKGVEAEHVRAAKANTRSFVTEAKLQLLQDHPLYVLKGIARKLGRARTKTFLTTGEAEEAYQLVAEEHEEKPRGHTQFWKYLNELETAGWIRLKRPARTGESGNTQNISLPDVPAKILVGKIDQVLAQSERA